MTRQLLILSFIIGLFQCSSPKKELSSLTEIASGLESIPGKDAYLQSPYVTAGDRVYMVGHQDGSFPDLGWHIDGEMGGIWNHPIKLMDGFSFQLENDEMEWTLDSATLFQNFAIGNVHTFENSDLIVHRFQFVPEREEGLIIEVSIKNKSSLQKSFNLKFTGHVDLRPTWLAERQNIEDGEDEGKFSEKLNAFIANDSDNSWSVIFGGNEGFTSTANGTLVDRKGNGTDFSLGKEISLDGNETKHFQFFISGSYESEEKAIATYNQIKTNPERLLQHKIDAYQLLESTNLLATGDSGIDKMFRWIKYNTQWLVRDVPEVGRGVSAGIPDYPWWFGTDGAYIIQGLVSAGMHEEAMNTIDLIIELSRKENGNGKIVHEVSSNGIVFNPGNLNTTPTFIHALWKAYEWTGNEKILDYYEDVKQGITWIESKDTDGNGYPDGAGMMEIHGLDTEMIDVIAYLYQAYVAAANFATVLNDENSAGEYSNKAQKLKKRINDDWWVTKENSFADFQSNYEKFIETLEGTIDRLDTLTGLSKKVQEQRRASIEYYLGLSDEFEDKDALLPRVVHSNWVVNTPMEVGAASAENAEKAFETARQYTSRFGVYVTGVDKKEEQKQATKWKAFSYVSAVMTLPTGVQAIGEARYGNPDASLEYLKMLENSFSYALPGSMYEVSPDFGMVAQGWNIYAVAVPIVDYFFGIQPEAFSQKITIKPKMPSTWDEAKLENVRIGENEISISFTRDGEKETYEISQKLDWEISFAGSSNQIGIVN